MSLLSSIRMGGNTLQAMQIGLQVVGNNIANASTPGFIRSDVVYAPAPVQKLGRLILGTGVQIDGIVQKLDQFIEDRLRGAQGDRASAEVQEKAFQDLEVLLGELSDNDLSTSLTGFFNSIDEVLLNPGDESVRNLAVLKGEALTRELNRLDRQAGQVRNDLNNRVIQTADRINQLTTQISDLNLRIVTTEGGSVSASDAGALRDRRQAALTELSELIDVTVSQQTTGSVTVSLNGRYLVSETNRREVEVDLSSDGDLSLATIRYIDNEKALEPAAGELAGLYAARDEIIGEFTAGLDTIARVLAFEFNSLHTSGQGLTGFQELTGVTQVADADAALDAAELAFTPENGTFDLLVRNTNTGLTETHTIRVDLNGLDDDTSLASLAADLDAVEGVSAAVTPQGRLHLAADGADTDFAFAGDTSHVLAALGLNTFFVGTTAANLGINDVLKEDAALFAASQNGIGEDAHNAEPMAAFFDQPLESADGSSLASLYDQFVNSVAQGSTIAGSVADGLRAFEGTLDAELQSVSGVNLDEEVIRMITLQRIFQASARYIQTLSELMDVMVAL